MKGKHAHSSRNYMYVLLLVLSCVLIISGYLVYHFLEDTIPKVDDIGTTTTTTENTTASTIIGTTTTTDNITTYATTATTTVTKITSAGTTKEPSKDKVPFPETLFIGDSRTHGLSLYGKISDADFFAYTSFSSSNVLKKKLKFDGLGEVTLEQLLSKRNYKTVYIMLGINEIGSNLDTITNRYQTIIDKVKEKQPGAKIVVESTLHVGTARKDISNTRIDSLNEKLAALADNSTVYYLDVNPVFDDANGNMDKKYTSDGVHFYSKYYLLWRDYLVNNRIA